MTKKVNLYAWASISENGTVNGKVGNQNGKELKIAPWYNFGQNRTVRFKNVTKGKKCASIMKTLCNAKCIGYSQDSRYLLYDACTRYNWKWSEIKKAIKNQTFPNVNTDCSNLVTVAVNLAYGKVMFGRYTTTRDLITQAQKMKKHFTVLTVGHPDKPHKGDMELKPNKHVIMNV